MRLDPKLAIPFVLVFALSACATENEATPSRISEPQAPSTTPTPTAAQSAECPPTPIEVTITYELVTNASGGISIDAASNLPAGAVMNASFFVEGGFFAQDEGTLENGRVTFGPFSNKGTPLKGTYEMSITLPIARNQPDSVQACIGSSGEMLTGPLVSVEEITGDKVASIDAIVTVE